MFRKGQVVAVNGIDRFHAIKIVKVEGDKIYWYDREDCYYKPENVRALIDEEK